MSGITPSVIRAAARRLKGITVRTPALRSPGLDGALGIPVVCKAESLQRTGAFKLRGAYNYLALLPADQRARGVIGASSGNHAVALADAAHLLGLPATVVVPRDAPAVKVETAHALGAEVVTYDRYRQDRDILVARLAAMQGLAVVPSSDSPYVIAGAGTVALELFQDAPGVATLLVPVGGGGLAAGCAIWAKAAKPRVRVIGVEPASGADTACSLLVRRRVRIPTPTSIADGLGHTTPAPLPFEVNRRLLDGIVTVEDEHIAEAMALCLRHLNLVAEPSGAVALAAVAAGHVATERGPIGVVISGGNVDWPAYQALLGRLGRATSLHS